MESDLTEATARELLSETRGLRGDVAGLATTIGSHNERIRSNKRNLILLALAYGLGLVMFVVLAGLTYYVHLQVERNQATAARLERVTELGVCRSAAIIIGSAPANPRPDGSAEDYADALQALRDARRELGCTDPVIPPAIRPAPVQPPQPPTTTPGGTG